MARLHSTPEYFSNTVRGASLHHAHAARVPLAALTNATPHPLHYLDVPFNAADFCRVSTVAISKRAWLARYFLPASARSFGQSAKNNFPHLLASVGLVLKGLHVPVPQNHKASPQAANLPDAPVSLLHCYWTALAYAHT